MSKRIYWLILAVLLCSLPAAFCFRLYSVRAEKSLPGATLAQLEERVRQDPANGRALYYLGRRYADLGRLGPARAALTQAARLAPDDGDIVPALAGLLAEMRVDTEANALYLDYARRHPADARIHRERSVFLADRSVFSDALTEAQQAVRLDPADARAWRLVGLTALSLHRFGEAAEALRTAVRLDARDWRAFMALGDALSRQKQWESAIAAYRQALTIAPDVPGIQSSLGNAELAIAATPEAVAHAATILESANRADPRSVDALVGLAAARQRQHRLPEARRLLTEAMALSPEEKQIPFRLAAVCRDLGDRSCAVQAESYFARLQRFEALRSRVRDRQQLGKFDPSESLQLARSCMAFQDFPEARRQYGRLLDLPEYAPTARTELGEMQVRWDRQRAEQEAEIVGASRLPAEPRTGDEPARLSSLRTDARLALEQQRYEEAIHAGRVLLAAEPEDAAASEIIGLAADARGDIATAFPALRRAVERDPSRDRAAFALAHQYLLAGFIEEAKRRLEALAERHPKEAIYASALGALYQENLARYAKAEQLQRKALELAPGNTEYAVNLARTLAYANRFAESEALLRQTLQRAPADPGAEAALGILLERIGTNAERRQESETLLRRSLQRGVNRDRVEMALARLLLQDRNASEAVPLIEQAILRQPSAQAFFQLSRAYALLGNRERADYCRTAFEQRSHLENSLTDTLEQARISPQRPDLRLRLARLYKTYGDFAKAINQYQIYLKMRPRDPSANGELSELVGRLTAAGQMPPMQIFDQMVRSGKPTG